MCTLHKRSGHTHHVSGDTACNRRGQGQNRRGQDQNRRGHLHQQSRERIRSRPGDNWTKQSLGRSQSWFRMFRDNHVSCRIKAFRCPPDLYDGITSRSTSRLFVARHEIVCLTGSTHQLQAASCVLLSCVWPVPCPHCGRLRYRMNVQSAMGAWTNAGQHADDR